MHTQRSGSTSRTTSTKVKLLDGQSPSELDRLQQELQLLRKRVAAYEANEARLKQAESLSRLLARIPDTYSNEIYVFNTTVLQLVHVNQGACRNLGYSLEELTGITLNEIGVGFDESRFISMMHPLQAGYATELIFEHSFQRKDGTIYPVKVRYYLLRDETPPVYVAIAQDITEHKQTEAALHASQTKVNLLTRQNELILNAAGEGICGLDLQGNLTFLNPAAARLLDWDPVDLIGKPVHTTFYTPVRDGSDTPAVTTLQKGGVQRSDNTYFRRKDGSSFPVEYTCTPMRANAHESVGAVITFNDITERRQADEELRRARDELELRVQERTAELVQAVFLLQEEIHVRKEAEETLQETQRKLSTLMSNLPGVAYRRHIDSDWTMEFASEGCYDLTGYMPADLIGNLRVSYASLIHPEDREERWKDIQAAIAGTKPFEFQYRISTAKGEEKWVWEHGCGVLNADGEVIALEGFIIDATDRVSSYQLMERRIEERTHEIERRRQVAEGFYDILTILNSNSSVDSIIDYIAYKANTLLDADAGAIWQLYPHQRVLRVQAANGLDDHFREMVTVPVGDGITGRAVLSRGPATVTNMRRLLAETPQLEASSEIQAYLGKGYAAVISIPIIIKGHDEIYGAISLYYNAPREFTNEDIELAIAFSDQTALAIENSRLRAQVAQNVVEATRSHLARELHDAVTQTLFAANLIAEVLPQVWQRYPDEGWRRLEELRQLTKNALAEMRTLLLELRPTALAEVGLAVLLHQLTEAFSGRTRIPVTVTMKGRQQDLPPDVQVALYRIAQEALNNVVKHAKSRHVAVTLDYQTECAELSIYDDGLGFEPSRIASGHMGLRIMRERADDVGADLTIESVPNHHTIVKVRWDYNQRVI